MRMMPKAFHTWSQRLRLSAENEALIATIYTSPPVRRAGVPGTSQRSNGEVSLGTTKLYAAMEWPDHLLDWG